MPYTTPTTITTGQLVTASLMNNEWVNNIAFLANPPACRVYHNANQSVANGAVAYLSFNSERYDTDSMHNTVTNNGRITFNTAGLYHVFAQIVFASNVTGVRAIEIRRNGGNNIILNTVQATSAFNTRMGISTIWKFAAADYIECGVFQNSGGALNAEFNADYSPEFGATWIGLG